MLSLAGDLIDDDIVHELGKPVFSAYKKTRVRNQRELLVFLPRSTAGEVRTSANQLKRMFCASLSSSEVSDHLVNELGAICLARVFQYPDRDREEIRYSL